MKFLGNSELEIHDIYVIDESPGKFSVKTPIGVFFPSGGKPRNLLRGMGDINH